MTMQHFFDLLKLPTAHHRVSPLHMQRHASALTRHTTVTRTHAVTIRSSLSLVLLLVVLVGLWLPKVCGQPPTKIPDDVAKVVQQRLQEFGHGVEAGIWVSDSTGKVLFRHQSNFPRPTASAIKTAYLIELFADRSDALDQTPLELDAILQDTHPAVSHFTAEQRRLIRKELSNASVRRIGRIMMGSDPAENVVYNAAANVTTALLGGPEGLTRRLHNRSEDFRGIAIRRYMLADRKINGDNTATPEALGAVLVKLSAGKLNNVSPQTIQDIHSAIRESDSRHGVVGHHRYKDGSLNSDPRTRVRAGWWQTEDRSAGFVYVVMLEQSLAKDSSVGDEDARLTALTDELTQVVLAGIAD